jgi:hypothetical protein
MSPDIARCPEMGATPLLLSRLRIAALKELTQIASFFIFSFKIPQNDGTIWDITEL